MIEKLSNFNPEMHFFVCVNDRKNTTSDKPSCGPFIDSTQVKEVKKWIVAQGLAGRVIMTKTGCLGGCNSQGAVIATYPSGTFHKGFQTVEDIKNFVIKNASNLRGKDD